MEDFQNSRETNSDRIQKIFLSLSQLKIVFSNEQDELKIMREANTKLERELKDVQELEKSHRYHLQNSRDMIGNLQETVSQLVYLKRDNKKIRDDIVYKDLTLGNLEKEKEKLSMDHLLQISELQTTHEKHIEELNRVYESKVQQVQNEADTQIAQFSCVIEELRSKIKETEKEHRDKMNVVVLEYEEKIQRGAAQVAQLHDQLARQAAITDTNMDVYRKRLDELEEKLKQSQFKQYLAQTSYPSQYETQVERPYSANKDPFPDSYPADLEPVYGGNKIKSTPVNQNKGAKPNTLQVMYYGNKAMNTQKAAEKKGQFSISKKRKLYNEKDFQDF